MSIFWKHVSSVFAGAVIAQLIPIVGSLFIARIFAPNEFGEFSTWLAIITFASVVVTLRFEAVLAIEKDGVSRVKAVFVIFFVTILMAALLLFFMIISKLLLRAGNYIVYSPGVLLIIIVAALFLAMNQIWQAWAAAEGFFWKLNIMRLVQALTLVFVQVGAGMKYPTAISLMVGLVVASSIAFACSIMMMPKFIFNQFFKLAEFRDFFSRYRNFPLYALPADSINTIVGQLPILVISNRFGHEVTGYLALTMRVLGAPITLVGRAVLDVFKRYAILNIREKGDCRKLYVNTFIALFISAIILVVGIIFLAENIFVLAFGREWLPAANMAIWLLPMFALRMIASPLSYMAYLVERQHIDLLWQAGLLVVTVITLYTSASYQATLISYSVGYAFMYIIYIMISYRLSKG